MITQSNNPLGFVQKVMALADREQQVLSAERQHILFQFLAEADEPLIEGLDRLLAEKGLGDELFEKMRAAVVPFGARNAALSEVGAGLEGEVGQVLSLFASARNSTCEYENSLKVVNGQLAAATGRADLGAIVGSLVEASRRMERTAEHLETRLAESTSHIEVLNSRLGDLQRQTTIDSLTGIANRRHFDERLAAGIKAAGSTDAELCLCLGDIDLFKNFNDRYGHQTGDQVLRLVAQTMMKCARDGDVVARYGGEEFAILLPGTPLGIAIMVAERIRAAISAKPLVNRTTGDVLGNVTISIGVARYHAGEGAGEFVGRADQALYGAKNCGRNNVVNEAEMAPDTLDRAGKESIAFAH